MDPGVLPIASVAMREGEREWRNTSGLIVCCVELVPRLFTKGLNEKVH